MGLTSLKYFQIQLEDNAQRETSHSIEDDSAQWAKTPSLDVTLYDNDIGSTEATTEATSTLPLPPSSEEKRVQESYKIGNWSSVSNAVIDVRSDGPSSSAPLEAAVSIGLVASDAATTSAINEIDFGNIHICSNRPYSSPHLKRSCATPPAAADGIAGPQLNMSSSASAGAGSLAAERKPSTSAAAVPPKAGAGSLAAERKPSTSAAVVATKAGAGHAAERKPSTSAAAVPPKAGAGLAAERKPSTSAAAVPPKAGAGLAADRAKCSSVVVPDSHGAKRKTCDSDVVPDSRDAKRKMCSSVYSSAAMVPDPYDVNCENRETGNCRCPECKNVIDPENLLEGVCRNCALFGCADWCSDE